MATAQPAQRAAIVNLYSALFNRAPDASGLAFWAQAYADGVSLATITQSFMGTPEARASYPATQTSTQFVAAFYQTVFGRSADAGGLAFWTSALDAAGGAGSDAARAVLAGQIVGIVSQSLVGKPEGLSDAAYAQTVADRALFANKAVVGDYVATVLGLGNTVLAKQVLALVTQDPASIPLAIAFAANGGVLPTPEAPMPSLSITSADLAPDIVSKFVAYAGTIATVDASGMVSAQFAAVAGGIAKIAGGGIGGVLGLTLADYAGAALTTLAPKLASGATLVVTGTGSADIIALKQFARGTTIYASGGDDIFDAVVDATTPANTTLSALNGLSGDVGNDTLRVSVTGSGVNALNGAALSLIETIEASVVGSAQFTAPTGLTEVIAHGGGSLTVNSLASGAKMTLDGTASTGSHAAHYAAGATGNLSMLNAANADVLTIDGSTLTAVSIVKSGLASQVNSLVLGSNVSQLSFTGTGDTAIMAMSGGAAGNLSVTVASSGTFALSVAASAGVNVDASTSSGLLALSFEQGVGVVKGGSASDTIIVGGAGSLTGNGGADVFVVRAGAGQAATIDLASLNAKLVTITDFSTGDRISVETPTMPSTGGSFALQSFTGVGADLYAQAASVATQMQALATKVPYGAFVYGGDSYLLVDNDLDGLGVGDMLIKLTGTPTLGSISFQDDVLTMA